MEWKNTLVGKIKYSMNEGEWVEQPSGRMNINFKVLTLNSIPINSSIMNRTEKKLIKFP